MARIIKDSSYTKLSNLYYPATFFVPVDDYFNDYLEPYLNSGVYSLNALQVVRYHTLPYAVHPDQLKNNKFLLQTDLEHQRFQSDWTQGKHQLLNQDTPYPGNIEGYFPQKSWVINVIGVIECAGGVVYIIDRPLVFPMVF